MTLPRPVLIAILGLALCAAAFLATRSANDTGSAVTSVPSQPTPIVKHPAAKPAKPGHAGAKAHKAVPAQQSATAKANAAARAATAPQTTVAKPAKPAKPAVSPEVRKTLPAIKALASGKVVVFFFTQPGAADDTGAAIAVRALAQDKSVKVFKVGLSELETYRPVLAGAGVSQIPAIVAVKAGHKGRLLQGFVDARTLRQTVADARR
jgi:nucleoid-associated protein YgaU